MSSVRDAMLTALLEVLADSLTESTALAQEAVRAATSGNVNQAIGTLLTLEDDLPAAAGLMQTILTMQRRRLSFLERETGHDPQ